MGLHLGSHRRGSCRPPVPQRFDDAVNWTATLFNKVATKMGLGDQIGLLIAMGGYLDAISSHLDLGYLAAQVALEAFAKGVHVAAGRTVLVKDSRRWVKWVKANRDAIVAHGLDSDAGEKLLGKVEGAQQGPSTDRVAAALVAAGLVVPQGVLREIELRNSVAHDFLMGHPTERDIQKDVERRDLVLTLIAAMVAKHCGYDGPLDGPDRDEQGYPLKPDWWPHTGDGHAAETFLVLREVEPLRMPALEKTRKDRVAEAAYFRWLARGMEHGRDLDDWLEVERELCHTPR